jgi:hypothetical protein
MASPASLRSGPAINNFVFCRGEDIAIEWSVGANSASDAPAINVEGMTFEFKVKRTDSDPDPTLVATSTTIIDAVLGRIDTTIAAAQTADLEPGDYRCSLWRTNTGQRACLSRGNFSILDSVQDDD